MVSAGSRGDFQPLLALSVALKAEGHQVLLAAGPNFAGEAADFGIAFQPAGIDVRAHLQENHQRLDINPLSGTVELIRMARREVQTQLDSLLPLASGQDLIIGGGALLAVPTVAEAAGVPMRYIAYTPQMFRSRHHAPFIYPFTGLPGPLNELLWSATGRLTDFVLKSVLNDARRALGLPELRELHDHLFPLRTSIIAADPELCPVAPDVASPHPPVGSLELPDERPLPDDLAAFLENGPPPVYLGFGSMTDPDPTRIARILVDGARNAGRRAILSRGWAGFDEHDSSGEVFVTGPVSHRRLFPRCAVIVHHGGAGTTHAAARAGVPQVLVPHAYDQFQFAAWATLAGVAPASVPHTRFTWRMLASRIGEVVQDGKFKANAKALGARMQSRDALSSAVRLLTAIEG